MLSIKRIDGLERKVRANNSVKFDEFGITFHNEDLGLLECVTWDNVEAVSYSIEVTDAMREKSKKLQFDASDERKVPGRAALKS